MLVLGDKNVLVLLEDVNRVSDFVPILSKVVNSTHSAPRGELAKPANEMGSHRILAAVELVP